MPKQITEEQILEAVVEVILEKGYASATTRHIAERADVSEMTLFRRFGNKARLAIAAVTYVVSQNEVDGTYTGDVEADLKRVTEHYQRRGLHRFSRILPLMLLEIPRHPELSEVMEAPFENVSRIGALLMRYQEEGVLRREHPMHAVSGLLGPLIILKLLRDAGGEDRAPDVDIQMHVKTYLYGRSIVSNEDCEE